MLKTRQSCGLRARIFALHSAFFAACRKLLETRASLRYSAHIDKLFTTPSPPRKQRRNIMNVLKHMEAAFLFSLSVAGVASVAVETIPLAQASVPVQADVQAQATVQPTMQTVHVTAKRMTAEEKRQSLQAERAGSPT
jgi:hypothetical protein